MTLGIIIVFHNNETELINGAFLKQSIKYQNINLCLVNNASSDNTLRLLKEIKEEFQSHLEILDIKKNTSSSSAIRAGERYLNNNQNLKYIGYLNIGELNNEYALDTLLSTFNKDTKHIIKNQRKIVSSKQTKHTFIKNIFSVLEYIKHSNITYPKLIT